MILIDRKVPREVQLQQQTERCYDDYCFYRRFDMEKRGAFVRENMALIGENELVIPYLPVYLTTACSLNCEKCNNLMPMFHGRAFDFSWERTRKSLEIMLSQVREMVFCELVGGEPFLNKDLGEILDFVGKHEKIRQIVIVTNATVIPDENIIEKLMEYQVLVRVSDYGFFEKMSEFISALDRDGIIVRIQQDMKWNDPGGVEARGRNRDELKRQYNACEFSLKCKYLCEDKLFSCARAASLYHLGLFNDMEDIMEITENITGLDLRNFYLHDEGKICDYCDLFTKEGKLIPAAEQVGKPNRRHSEYTVISNYELNHYKEMTKAYEKILADKGPS